MTTTSAFHPSANTYYTDKYTIWLYTNKYYCVASLLYYVRNFDIVTRLLLPLTSESFSVRRNDQLCSTEKGLCLTF